MLSRRWCGFAALLLLSGVIPIAGGVFQTFQPEVTDRLKRRDCPTACSDVFGRLEWQQGGLGQDKAFQKLTVHERGEPKSGTGFMFETAMVGIAHACMYLQRAYGELSCRIEWDFFNRTLIFEPSRAKDAPGPCRCDDVDMVTIVLTNENKHGLPVEEGCRYARPNGIAQTQVACHPLDGEPQPENYAELVQCARDSSCLIVEDHLQMSVMRDPRPMVVSAYFHHLRTHPEQVVNTPVDEYVLNLLPAVCKWVAIRYLLFGEILSERSSLFWYDDASEKPEEVQKQLYDFMGVRVPNDVVYQAAAVAVGRVQDDRLSRFPAKGMDPRPEGMPHSYRDDVLPETLVSMDDALRVWLPPALQEKFGVL